MSTRVCDMCGAAGGGTFVSASQMRDAAAAGFHAYAPGIVLPPPLDTAPQSVRDEQKRRWMRRVDADVSDWDLCRACYAVFRRYNNEEPSPLGVREALAAPAETPDEGPQTILDELVGLGVYRATAGKETIGHFDPHDAPFFVCPGESAGDAPRLGVDPDLAARLVERLSLADPNYLVEVFDMVRGNPEVRQLLWTTTLEPFVTRYSIGQQRAIAEVMMQIELNALSHLLLSHPGFKAVVEPDGFLRAAVRFARQ